MSSLMKFLGGVALGAVIGAGVYLILTQEEEDGPLAEVKTVIVKALEEGRQAAAEQRRMLEQELHLDSVE